MRSARVLAQAKINLFLNVGERDASGYHALDTLFQRIDLADEVVVRVGGTARTIECSGARMPPHGLGVPEQNLAYRAAAAYAERTGWPRGFAIELTKHIPVGGGLGGGSADAAAVLRALNAMADHPWPDTELLAVGATLGADVPFLASNRVLSFAAGRGDVLIDPPEGWSEPLPERNMLILVPSFGVATADAYRWLDSDRVAHPPMYATGVVGKPLGTGWAVVAQLSHNDFEPVVQQRHPQIRTLRRRLEKAGAGIARMSGSGSTVYGIFDGPVPPAQDLGVDALAIPTRTSSRVVQVEVLE
jgi:4-diphosphocytidyl-2-C-methyl-D-erythritol kinase